MGYLKFFTVSCAVHANAIVCNQGRPSVKSCLGGLFDQVEVPGVKSRILKFYNLAKNCSICNRGLLLSEYLLSYAT